MKTKTEPKTESASDTADLMLLSSPTNLLDLVRQNKAALLPTKQLTIFYVMCDVIEKGIRKLKDTCKTVIVGRRDEGTPAGEKLQHREFHYTTLRGAVSLTVQERITQTPDPEKLEALLKTKCLWELAMTTVLDLDKVDGMRQAGMITPEEFAAVSSEPKPVYALIARLGK